MSVEILILSGSKQGQKLELDSEEFRAGGDSSCEICFDPSADISADGRVALLKKTEEGWWIRNVGAGELLLNEQTVTQRMRIRSGDIVRLSDRGPDFSFEIVPARMVIHDDSTSWQSRAAAVQQPVSAAADGSQPSDLQDGDLLQNGVEAESMLPPLPPRRSHKWPIVAGATLTVVLLVAIIATITLTPSDSDTQIAIAGSDQTHIETGDAAATAADAETVDAAGTVSTADTNDDIKESHAKPTGPAVENRGASGGDKANIVRPFPTNTYTDNNAAVTQAKAADKDVWATIANDYGKTVWLLEVGDAEDRFIYPFASAVAIDKRLLLTTASAAEELERFKAKGWKIIAANAALQQTVDIGQIRLHGVYADLAGDREEQIYVDLAVLETKQVLEHLAKPASVPELATLDTGTELVCLGVPHSADAMRSEDAARAASLVPKMFRGKLFLRTKLDPRSPSGPRLLHFKAALGENMYGSPVVNSQGHVVAIYAETAAGGEGLRLGLSYAPMLDPALIRLAIEGRSRPYWVPPARQPGGNRNGSNSR